jgi:DNA polymerase-3 subunit delta'
VLPATERHPHARAVLSGALPPDGRPSHAYLFHGPAGTGKRTVARAVAAALLGEHERVSRGSHPDLTWVTPSGAHELLVSDVDEAVVAAATVVRPKFDGLAGSTTARAAAALEQEGA